MLSQRTGILYSSPITMRFEYTEARDAALASGMESGNEAACNKLDELLVTYV